MGQVSLAVGHLSVVHNHFTGIIPLELGNASILVTIFCQDNQLSGGILSKFGVLSMLEVLCLDQNQLSGSIPVKLFQVAISTNGWVNTADNSLFSGTIPCSVCSMMKFLNFDCAPSRIFGYDWCPCWTITYLTTNHNGASTSMVAQMPAPLSGTLEFSFNRYMEKETKKKEETLIIALLYYISILISILHSWSSMKDSIYYELYSSTSYN